MCECADDCYNRFLFLQLLAFMPRTMPKQYIASDFGISPQDLGQATLTTLHTLQQAGFDAYIVGGSVRDLLLGLHPKDFDIATNATPEQVKRVFGRHCQIIGRRFQLAHVYQDRHLFEVATFRAPHQEHSAKSQTSAQGLIMRDNVWGTIEQDALRRDFTANALYYNPQTGIIWDFANGLTDIQHKILRIIGNPSDRYREDPVRMLRAARFAVKLGFELEQQTAAPIAHLAYLLKAISHHRLYDESHKLFSCGHLSELLPLLHQMGLFQALFPLLDDNIVQSPLVQLAAQNTDERLQQGKSVNPAFFYAVLLWDWQQQQAQKLIAKGADYFPAQQTAAMRVLNLQSQSTAIPRHTAQTIREIWELQPRLATPKSRLVPNLITQPRFRAGFDFLLLREQSGAQDTHNMAEWWEHYQSVDADTQEKLLKDLDKRKARAVAKEKAANKAQNKPKRAKKPKDTHALSEAQQP